MVHGDIRGRSMETWRVDKRPRFPVVTIGVLPEWVAQELLIWKRNAVNLNIVDS